MFCVLCVFCVFCASSVKWRERSARHHVAERRTRVTKGTPAAAAAAEEVVDHDDDLPDSLDDLPERGEVCFGR